MVRAREQVGSLLADRRSNAVAAWLLLGFLAVVAAEAVLLDDLLWAGFVAFVLLVGLVPPVAYRDPEVMLPWEVLAMAALPMLGRVLATVELTSDLAMYLSVAALALVIAVELQVFTAVKMTYGFAVAFVVVATVATAGVWAVVRWLADNTLGTTLLLHPGVPESTVEHHLMWEFTYSAAAGVLGGVIFELYFRRVAPVADRLAEGEP